MKSTFVVRLDRNPDHPRRMEGSIEEVETGKELRFHSKDELVAFLAERNAAAANPNPTDGQTKGRSARNASEKERPE